MASAEEAAIIKKRLLTQVASTSTADPPFTRLVKTYTQFCQAVAGGTLEEATRLRDEVLVELYGIQLHIERLNSSAAAYTSEQEYYAKQQEKLQSGIEQATTDIETRKNELAAARIRLAQQQEYEAVKLQVIKVPARSVTRAEMTSVEKEIADLQQQSRDLEQLMERRRGQFNSIVAVMEEVYTSIQQEGRQDDGEAVDNEGNQPMAVE